MLRAINQQPYLIHNYTNITTQQPKIKLTDVRIIRMPILDLVYIRTFKKQLSNGPGNYNFWGIELSQREFKVWRTLYQMLAFHSV